VLAPHPEDRVIPGAAEIGGNATELDGRAEEGFPQRVAALIVIARALVGIEPERVEMLAGYEEIGGIDPPLPAGAARAG
jgi:hypothetical protein